MKNRAKAKNTRLRFASLVSDLKKPRLGVAEFSHIVEQLQALDNGEGMYALTDLCSCTTVNNHAVAKAVHTMVESCVKKFVKPHTQAKVVKGLVGLLSQKDPKCATNAVCALVILSILSTNAVWDFTSASSALARFLDSAAAEKNPVLSVVFCHALNILG